MGWAGESNPTTKLPYNNRNIISCLQMIEPGFESESDSPGFAYSNRRSCLSPLTCNKLIYSSQVTISKLIFFLWYRPRSALNILRTSTCPHHLPTVKNIQALRALCPHTAIRGCKIPSRACSHLLVVSVITSQHILK